LMNVVVAVVFLSFQLTYTLTYYSMRHSNLYSEYGLFHLEAIYGRGA
jgi:hypothetical protein